MHPAQQDAAEHDMLATAGVRNHECPSCMKQRGRAHSQVTRVQPQIPCEPRFEVRACFCELHICSMHVEHAERCDRLIDVGELAAEECFCIMLACIRKCPCDIASVGHRVE